VAHSQHRPETRRLYLESVRAFLSYAGVARERWTLANVEAWRDHQRRQGIKPSTINTRLAALRYASRRYAALGHGPHFAGAVELLAVDHGKARQALTVDQARALVATTEPTDTAVKLRDRALLVVALRTGLRRTELAQLGSSTIERVGDAVRARVLQKGGTPLTITFDAEAWLVLADWARWLERQMRGPVGGFFRALRTTVADEVAIGQPIAPRGLWRIITERARAAGLRRVTTHTLRHTYYSMALASGVRPERVAASVGHRRLDQVMRYYTDLHADHDPVGGHLPALVAGRSR